MTNANQAFQKALEEYVFIIANAFIEAADQTTQHELVELLNRITSQASSAQSPANPLETEANQQAVNRHRRFLN